MRTGKIAFIFESKLKSLSFLKVISIESLLPYSNEMRKKFSYTLFESWSRQNNELLRTFIIKPYIEGSKFCPFVKYLRLQVIKELKSFELILDIFKVDLYKIDKSTKINHKELEHDKINQ